MRLEKLPGWVVDDATSVRDEVAEYRGVSAERLWELTRACARASAWTLGFHEDPKAALERVDPVPASTLEALARLRAKATR